jgi:hypothetical protein
MALYFFLDAGFLFETVKVMSAQTTMKPFFTASAFAGGRDRPDYAGRGQYISVVNEGNEVHRPSIDCAGKLSAELRVRARALFIGTAGFSTKFSSVV